MAQDFTTEVGPATVWFALLVVVFVLLVTVGLYLAYDRDGESDSIQSTAKAPTHRHLKPTGPRNDHFGAKRRKQEKYS